MVLQCLNLTLQTNVQYFGKSTHASKDSNLESCYYTYGVFTLDPKSMLDENLCGILSGTQC